MPVYGIFFIYIYEKCWFMAFFSYLFMKKRHSGGQRFGTESPDLIRPEKKFQVKMVISVSLDTTFPTVLFFFCIFRCVEIQFHFFFFYKVFWFLLTYSFFFFKSLYAQIMTSWSLDAWKFVKELEIF
ncbi:hypothetical protein RhiirC2_719629 [Rhizophagus irregularis]|uniref:Uncharacterized protein n=1 Tax=Rhizophagus irregularis TaxID=588596 RepID=A0A2N1MDS5_9GLOM|nr:hypothetical protein RhiirC2_719629 [Rhizophagus irregularis]